MKMELRINIIVVSAFEIIMMANFKNCLVSSKFLDTR